MYEALSNWKQYYFERVASTSAGVISAGIPPRVRVRDWLACDVIYQVQWSQKECEGSDVRNILRKINSADGNIIFESTVVGNISCQGEITKRVSFVSHLLLLSLLISFTTSASTAFAVASLF